MKKNDNGWIYLLIFLVPWGLIAYKGFTDPEWDNLKVWILIFGPIIFLIIMKILSKFPRL
jgi:hypothetical protein